MTGRASQQCQDDRAGLLASGGQPRGWTIDRTWEIQAAASDVFFVFLRIRHHHLFCYILFSAPIFRMSGWQRIFCTRLWLQEIRYVYSSGRDDDAWSGVVWLWEAPTKFSHNSAACLLHYRICVQTAAIKKKISQFTAIIIIITIPLLRKCQRPTNPVPHSPSQQWWYCLCRYKYINHQKLSIKYITDINLHTRHITRRGRFPHIRISHFLNPSPIGILYCTSWLLGSANKYNPS